MSDADGFDMPAIWAKFSQPKARKAPNGGVELIPDWEGTMQEIGRQLVDRLEESITDATHPPVPGMTPDYADGWRSATEVVRDLFGWPPWRKVTPVEISPELRAGFDAAGDDVTRAIIERRRDDVR